MTRSRGSGVEWVAAPPREVGSKRPARSPRRYPGPPAYRATPRWGFPTVAWRWPLALAHGAKTDPLERLVSIAGTAVSVLWCTGAVAALGVLAEVFRYVLLLRSRDMALSRATVAISDALVGTAGVLVLLLGIASVVLVVLWALRARPVASERARMRSPRPSWQVVAGVLIPGANLLIPGSALAELEHAILVGEGVREAGWRPRPSRLLLSWWLSWAATLLLGWASFAWLFRGGVQAAADGVVLHAWNDLAVLVLALLTIRVISRATRLLVPLDADEIPRMRVLGVRGAPAPPRAQRPRDAAR